MGAFGRFLFILVIAMPGSAQAKLSWVQIEDKMDCEKRFLSRQLCIVSKVKTFTDEEVHLLQKRLESLQQDYPKFFAKLLKNTEKVQFFRHTVGARRVSSHSFKKDENMGAWVTPGRKFVHLPDKFFVEGTPINDKHDSIDYLLIHELSHVIDNVFRKPSAKKEFLDLYQWQKVPTGEIVVSAGVEIEISEWQTMGVSVSKVLQLREEVMELHNQGRGDEGQEISLAFGQSHGHPGSYSMLNPHENFAEIIVSYFMDPITLRTAPLEVHAWLDSFFND